MNNKKIIVTVSEHSWLDCSVSWFVHINGVKSGGECFSKTEAIEIGKSLAKQLGGVFVDEVNSTNELFS